MLTINDLLQALEPLNKRLASLEQGQQGLKQDVAGIQQAVKQIETGQGQLSETVKTLDLKIETVHAYQQKAHTEIMDRLFESNEANGQEQQRLEKRIERIEKHLGLPPLK